MARYYYRPWKDGSLISALHFLRCRIVREDQPGLEHVDALLTQLGVDPAELPVPQKINKHFKRNELRQAILETLRDGPLTGAQITERVRGELDYKTAYKRVYGALAQMRNGSLVERSCGSWRQIHP